MNHISNFRDLIAWQRAIELADLVYDITEDFPKREWFGLAYQMRKSAVSIPSNIAEGHRRRTSGYVYHLEVALGSHGELDTQSVIGTRRRFIPTARRRRLEDLIAEVGRITNGLYHSIELERRT
jgi:four helix bundle protein